MQFLEQEEKKRVVSIPVLRTGADMQSFQMMIEDGQSRGMARGRRGEEAHGGLELY
jgi:hypothetical protein